MVRCCGKIINFEGLDKAYCTVCGKKYVKAEVEEQVVLESFEKRMNRVFSKGLNYYTRVKSKVDIAEYTYDKVIRRGSGEEPLDIYDIYITMHQTYIKKFSDSTQIEYCKRTVRKTAVYTHEILWSTDEDFKREILAGIIDSTYFEPITKKKYKKLLKIVNKAYVGITKLTAKMEKKYEIQR